MAPSAFALGKLPGSTMNKVLAPSNIGFKSQSYSTNFRWRPVNSPNGWVDGSATKTVLASYKSPTIASDGERPTQYCRMINKLVPLGPVDCSNYITGGSYLGKYVYQSDRATTVEVRSTNLPFGSNVAGGKVEVPSWMVDAVVSDCIDQMNGINANIYEDLGQAAQPFQMYVGTYRAIILLFLSARAGQWKFVRAWLRQNGQSVPRGIANGWLMYFYGIKPLLSTLEELVKSDKPRFGQFQARARREISHPNWAYTSGGYWVQGNTPVKVQAQAQFRARYRVSADTEKYWRMGITGSPADALITAWALAPYSFVVDWILPVESFLKSLIWSPTIEYEGGFVGRRHYGDATLTDLWPWSGAWPYKGQLPRYSHQVRFYQRVTYPYRVPGVGVNLRLTLNLNQTISAAALIATR